MKRAPRPLPTLLGTLVLLVGLIAFVQTRSPKIPLPPLVELEPLSTTSFQAVLTWQTGSEVRTRDVTLRAADTSTARLTATLRALRVWLLAEGVWPRSLGAPRVFWLADGGAALDFSLASKPDVPVAAELWLLESLRRTAARQGVAEPFVLVNGQVPPTFLGQVALPQTLGTLTPDVSAANQDDDTSN